MAISPGLKQITGEGIRVLFIVMDLMDCLCDNETPWMCVFLHWVSLEHPILRVIWDVEFDSDMQFHIVTLIRSRSDQKVRF